MYFVLRLLSDTSFVFRIGVYAFVNFRKLITFGPYFFFQIYNRLQRVGICINFRNGTRILDAIKGGFHKKAIDAVRQSKHIRIIGDNIDFVIGVRDERMKHHGKLHHYFGSAFLVHNYSFKNLSLISPQRKYQCTKPADLMLSKNEEEELVKDYINIVVSVAIRFFPVFQFLESPQPTTSDQADITQKTLTIPLPALHRHEQEYGDVCEILRFYEKLIAYIYSEAGIDLTDSTKVHIGGDQLTRERFCGAKRLMIGVEGSGADRFQHLEPISFEFFHLSMKFLGVCYKRLFKEGSLSELGTMKAEQTRIARTSVKKEVTKAYTPDKEFFVSYVDCYIVEALCEHFHLDDPKQDIPSAPEDLQRRKEWAMAEIRKMVTQLVGTFSYRKGI